VRQLFPFHVLLLKRPYRDSSNCSISLRTISGLVLDPRAAPIAARDSNRERCYGSAVFRGTNEEGIYAIATLPPGPYRLQVLEGRFQDSLSSQTLS
jgi:hypothetical protein